jgi:hypothetical protein
MAEAPTAAIGAAEAYITGTLSDPESAKFDSVIAVKAPNGKTVVCGLVNAKNKFGGYVGRKAFYYDGTIGVGEIADPMFAGLFDSYKYCGLNRG